MVVHSTHAKELIDTLRELGYLIAKYFSDNQGIDGKYQLHFVTSSNGFLTTFEINSSDPAEVVADEIRRGEVIPIRVRTPFDLLNRRERRSINKKKKTRTRYLRKKKR